MGADAYVSDVDEEKDDYYDSDVDVDGGAYTHMNTHTRMGMGMGIAMDGDDDDDGTMTDLAGGLITLGELDSGSDADSDAEADGGDGGDGSVVDSDGEEPRHFTFQVNDADDDLNTPASTSATSTRPRRSMGIHGLGIDAADRELTWALADADGDAGQQSLLDAEVAAIPSAIHLIAPAPAPAPAPASTSQPQHRPFPVPANPKPSVSSAFAAYAAMRHAQGLGSAVGGGLGLGHGGAPSLPPMPVLSIPRMPTNNNNGAGAAAKPSGFTWDAPDTASDANTASNTSTPAHTSSTPSSNSALTPSTSSTSSSLSLETLLAPALATLPYPLLPADFIALNSDPMHHRTLYTQAAAAAAAAKNSNNTETPSSTAPPPREPALSVLARVHALLTDLAACPHAAVALVTHPVIARVMLGRAQAQAQGQGQGKAAAQVAGGQVVRLELVY
jgi:hypothetical protein